MTLAALDAATLEKLVAAAVAAPSIHNTQPWRFRLDPDTTTIEVRASIDRGLRHTDPTGRALHISVGAAVFNLRVAVAHFGWEPVVRLLPHPAEPELLAAVRLAGPRADRKDRRDDLYDALWRRHSSRVPFSGVQIPPEVMAEIADAAAAEGTRITFPPRTETTRLLRLTADAERFTSGDRARTAETRSWMRGDEGATDGMPSPVLGKDDVTGRLPLRDFTGHRHPGNRRPAALYEAHPIIAVLTTQHDSRADWLRSGQGLEHVLLVATANHLKASLFSQPTEWPELRWVLRNPREGHEHVQMLIRLGYGPETPAAPRRPVRDVLEP